MRITILHSAIHDSNKPDEQDTLIQVQSVENILNTVGHSIVCLPFEGELIDMADRLKSTNPDLVFNLVESVDGQARYIHLAPALMEATNIPFTGSSSDSLFCTTNKLMAKRMMRLYHIQTPPWLTTKNIHLYDKLPAHAYIIKSVWEHASIGLDEDSVIISNSPSHLFKHIEKKQELYGGEFFAEQYIEGREFNLTLLAKENEAELLPPAEIIFQNYPKDKKRVVGYRAKWVSDSFEFSNTPRCFDIDEEDQYLLWQLKELAKRCWKLFGLEGYARIDFRIDQSGHPWVLEVNTNPCLSPDSGFIAAAQKAGYTLNDVIERIVQFVNHSTCDALDQQLAV